MTWSLDAENAFDKIQHTFRIKKNTQQIRNRRILSQHNWGHTTWETPSSHHAYQCNTERFSCTIGIKARMPGFATYIQHRLEVPAR